MYCTIFLYKYNIKIWIFLVFTDSNSEKPECLLRVEKLAEKNVTFINCDITNVNDLRNVFQKVNILFVHKKKK